jgi:hypothetical protein
MDVAIGIGLQRRRREEEQPAIGQVIQGGCRPGLVREEGSSQVGRA